MIPAWCIDENQRDVLAEAFAVGSFLAIATRDMTGRLSDAPALAGQVKRLARLRKATARSSATASSSRRAAHGQGREGFAYLSPAARP